MLVCASSPRTRAPCWWSEKAVSGGIPLGAYGMTELVAAVLDSSADTQWGEGVATGGTLFGNALSMAAARATLEQV